MGKGGKEIWQNRKAWGRIVHKITAHVPSLTCFSYTGGLCLMNEYLNTNIMTAMLLLSLALFALFLFLFICSALFVPRNSTIDKTTGTTGIRNQSLYDKMFGQKVFCDLRGKLSVRTNFTASDHDLLSKKSIKHGLTLSSPTGGGGGGDPPLQRVFLS